VSGHDDRDASKSVAVSPPPGADKHPKTALGVSSLKMTTLVMAALTFRVPVMHMHANRDRTASPRRGLVSLAEVPQADLKTALPPSLAEALAGDDSLADAQLTCVLLATSGALHTCIDRAFSHTYPGRGLMHPGACAEVSKALRVLSLAPASAQAGGKIASTVYAPLAHSPSYCVTATRRRRRGQRTGRDAEGHGCGR
jgi:hypothetical protein